MVPLLVIATIAILLLVELAQRRKPRATLADARLGKGPRVRLVPALKAFALDSVPRGLFFDRGHTWVHLEPSGSIRLGADMLPSTFLGDVDNLKVRPAGTEIRQGDPILTMMRGGRQITLHSPVDGTIQEVNAMAGANPRCLRRDPFGAGWVYRLAPRNLAGALEQMVVGDGALRWMRGELERVRELLCATSSPAALAGATLPDGGLPIEGIHEHLDETSWQKLVDELFYRWPTKRVRK